MVNKLEKQRKKQIWNDLRKTEKIDFEQNLPMEKQIFENLFGYLNKQLVKNGCDHTNKMTKDYLENEVQKNTKNILEWFAENGGYCDCEILANVEEKFDFFEKPKEKNSSVPIKRRKLDTLSTEFGFYIARIPAPWILTEISLDNIITYQFQIGKKSDFYVILEKDFPIDELSQDYFLEDYWKTKTELNRNLEFVISRQNIQKFETITIQTKKWTPIFIFAHKPGMKWCLIMKTETIRLQNDVKELEKLLKEL